MRDFTGNPFEVEFTDDVDDDELEIPIDGNILIQTIPNIFGLGPDEENEGADYDDIIVDNDDDDETDDEYLPDADTQDSDYDFFHENDSDIDEYEFNSNPDEEDEIIGFSSDGDAEPANAIGADDSNSDEDWDSDYVTFPVREQPDLCTPRQSPDYEKVFTEPALSSENAGSNTSNSQETEQTSGDG